MSYRSYGHRQPAEFQLTSKSILVFLGIVAMDASAVYWWGIQSVLTQNRPMALAYTSILVLAPPALTWFLIPWSAGGMLLQRVNARTWGFLMVTACTLTLNLLQLSATMELVGGPASDC